MHVGPHMYSWPPFSAPEGPKSVLVSAIIETRKLVPAISCCLTHSRSFRPSKSTCLHGIALWVRTGQGGREGGKEGRREGGGGSSTSKPPASLGLSGRCFLATSCASRVIPGRSIQDVSTAQNVLRAPWQNLSTGVGYAALPVLSAPRRNFRYVSTGHRIAGA
eukprot:2712499-Rhodomonas_salina.2